MSDQRFQNTRAGKGHSYVLLAPVPELGASTGDVVTVEPGRDVWTVTRIGTGNWSGILGPHAAQLRPLGDAPAMAQIVESGRPRPALSLIKGGGSASTRRARSTSLPALELVR